MAILDFAAISAQLVVGVGKHERKSAALSYQVRLAASESIELTTDEKFGDLDGSIFITSDESDLDRESVCGKIRYFKATEDGIDFYPSSYNIHLCLSEAHLSELLAAARLGRAPSTISIETDGMEYGWEPDGSGKKWDNQAFPELAVLAARFLVPLYKPIAVGEEDRHPIHDSMPPSRGQVDMLYKRVEHVSSEIKAVTRNIIWAAVIVGVFVLLRK